VPAVQTRVAGGGAAPRPGLQILAKGTTGRPTPWAALGRGCAATTRPAVSFLVKGRGVAEFVMGAVLFAERGAQLVR
jgi:hypothetical protein